MSWIEGALHKVEERGTKLAALAAGPPDPYVCIEIYEDEPMKGACQIGHIHVRDEADRRALAAVLLAGLDEAAP